MHRRLADAGYPGYEVSNFAESEGHRSRHNTKYWNHTPYLGLGPSAHSFHDRRRWWNLRRTDDWQAAIDEGRAPVEDEERLDARALALESVMLGFRTYAGVDTARLRSDFGVDLMTDEASVVTDLTRRGLITVEGVRLVPTLDGLAVADSLAASFSI